MHSSKRSIDPHMPRCSSHVHEASSMAMRRLMAGVMMIIEEKPTYLE